MTHNQIDYYRMLLLHRIRELLGRDYDEGLKEICDAKDHIPDEGDLANLEMMRNIAFIIGDKQRNRVREIRDALNRIDLGEFGKCMSCGNAISEKRLAVYPTTTFCILCKKRQEERQRSMVA
ncbi:MAG TPA: TraR/DksA C4-type zinc finger protein [Syntrophales bacterium]|nr:TraR/DksA C4-type zinc finger protein [Syntrophales bacterium]HPQ45367.1 TraR/DksA C4-type zinc finger protein [Syntrophales bacterium]